MAQAKTDRTSFRLVLCASVTPSVALTEIIDLAGKDAVVFGRDSKVCTIVLLSPLRKPPSKYALKPFAL